MLFNFFFLPLFFLLLSELLRLEELCLAADACVDRVGKLKQTPRNRRAAVVLSNLAWFLCASAISPRHAWMEGGSEGGSEGRGTSSSRAAPRTQCALTQDGYQRALRSVASPHIPLGRINLKDDVNLIVSKNVLYQMTGLIRLQDKAIIIFLLFNEGRLTSV